MKRAGVSVALATFAVVVGVAAQGQSTRTPQQAAPAAPPANVENGKKIYTTYGCYECHGYEAQGGSGPKLGPEAIAFEAFVRVVRQPPNQMPPYTAKVVTDQEMADIYAFVKSVPQPPKVETIPLLKTIDP